MSPLLEATFRWTVADDAKGRMMVLYVRKKQSTRPPALLYKFRLEKIYEKFMGKMLTLVFHRFFYAIIEL